MKKIVHVLTDTNVGGAGIWLLNFLKSFRCNGYDIVVVLPRDAELVARVKEIGIKVREVEDIADKSLSLKGIFRLKKVFSEERPDIVHSHASLSARIAARMCKIKTINTRHCLEDVKTGIKKEIYSFINNNLSDLVIGVSAVTCKNLVDCGTKEDKVRLVYNGVFPLLKYDDEKRAFIKEKYNIKSDACVVGIVARLEDTKNHKLFIDAAELILKEEKETMFLIVGGGSLEKELKEYAAKKGISDKVIFTGYLSDVTEAMNIIDINTLTSKKEALSISLIEGMSIRLPAVSTNSGGPAEVVENGVNGFLVENENSRAFADAVLELIRNPEKRELMGIEAEKTARETFSPEAMVMRLERVYKEV